MGREMGGKKEVREKEERGKEERLRLQGPLQPRRAIKRHALPFLSLSLSFFPSSLFIPLFIKDLLRRF